MPGITNLTNVTYSDVEYIVNVSSVPEFFIKVNHYIYEGWLFFVLLVILTVIFFYAGQTRKDQILTNMMYATASTTILSFILRGIYVVNNGILEGLMTDKQLWVFPIMTAVIAVILWATKD